MKLTDEGNTVGAANLISDGMKLQLLANMGSGSQVRECNIVLFAFGGKVLCHFY